MAKIVTVTTQKGGAGKKNYPCPVTSDRRGSKRREGATSGS
ncbi:hypothetical protein ME788_16780 [Lactobacillus delbrueckii]|nr:hypothetical protein ME786_18200 [Lactobacillus delbrueckii]GHN27128.1 hypothetical protein ME787_18430 [Lactobacillus delbrueckii]GHN28866.1 hypothetical protein ME788_16780 [Lactobacillus delbrueckii]